MLFRSPTGVNDLLAEFANIGLTIWWDEVDQKIKLRANRPAWGDEEIKDLSEDYNNISIEQEDRDTDRINQVNFYLDTINISASHTDERNYSKLEAIADAEMAGEDAYNDNRIRTITSRILDNGDSSSARVFSKRLLNRFRLAPKRVIIEVDYRDDMAVCDVVRLRSKYLVNADGTPSEELYQVIRRQDAKIGSRVRLVLQRYFYTQRYAAITPNDMPDYSNATDEQRSKYAFFAASDGTQWGAAPFNDGSSPYNFI